MPLVRVRPFHVQDREAVRQICADTGFLGQPIDPVFEDRELFADYLTGYYLRFEPESTLVCEVDGRVMGYLMGCRRPLAYQAYQAVVGNLQRSGHNRVCGQMVSYDDRRTDALFERYGFQVLHRSEVSKYRNVHPGRVFVCTVVKDLSAGASLRACR